MLYLAVIRRAGGLAAPTVGNEEMEAANPWAMLLRTFLPWVNAGRVPDYGHEDEEEAAVAEESENQSNPSAALAEAQHEDDDLD